MIAESFRRPRMKEDVCSLLILQGAPPCRILERDIHNLDRKAKECLFRHTIASTNRQTLNASRVLDKLCQLSPSVARNFELKSDAFETITMRLLNQRDDRHVPESSYIALSYCWQSIDRAEEEMMAITVTAPGYPLPISPPLFQALLAECKSATEGIWCDQICIDQDNESEKVTAISAMDIVYKSAREVVVALDDVEVNEEEQAFLQEYIDSYEFSIMLLGGCLDIQARSSGMEADHVFRKLFEKIIGARWFKRVLFNGLPSSYNLH